MNRLLKQLEDNSQRFVTIVLNDGSALNGRYRGSTEAFVSFNVLSGGKKGLRKIKKTSIAATRINGRTVKV